ncbi:AMP-dependent synthetase/ligase [Micromonospora endophytica]|uniref:Acyl-CoA synthetase n=1 Tax=Micromonospora endophytica TaxID=515350 RepID=A0A2W2BZ34_9ACTN|nr:AMP-dependent synthetase/ligase [Micromonospora endophytica]PZF92511.1 long-chain fatty acid--CoA ligase [Micromonospora endophytica]RIW42790.1 long-chain fatty acid--CoA ligase [Micromonospora endophytica]BCJ62721.1 long-chain acyl-CoA synthetase [Micromonospora endophytica]
MEGVRETAAQPNGDGGDVNLAEQVWRNAAADADAVQFIRPDPDPRSWPVRRSGGGGPLPVTCRQFRDDVLALARGFLAAGVAHADRVGLLCRTRYEWTLVDYALWSIGAVTVPIYDTSSVDQIRWIIGDSGAVGCVVETAEHAAIVHGLRPDLPRLRQTWRIDAGDLIELAAGAGAVDTAQVDARRDAVTGEDMATIVYTSGTTGAPKGCVLTHRNISVDVTSAVAGLPQLLHPGASTVLFLPLAHAFARLIQVGVVHTRATMVHSADMSEVLDQLRRFRPTFILAVPRMFEKMHDQARRAAEDGHRGGLFTLGERLAVRYSRALDRPTGPGLALRLAHLFFDVVAYRRLRAALGGRCRMAIVGGAPLGERLGHFFRGVGITVLEGYGLTETSPALAANLPAAMRIGTVGRPLPGVQIRIADNGEILARSQVVFVGYWNNPEATEETFTDDGWLHTGDLGHLDDDGFLRITGRTKEIMVTAAGKNVAPAPIEERVRAHPLVSQCMLVADGRPYVAALVSVDPPAWQRWRDAHGHPGASLADLRDDPQLRAEIQEAIDQANRTVSHAEQVKTFRILPRDLTEADGELTPTLKIKREVVQDHFAEDIAALYRRR